MRMAQRHELLCGWRATTKQLPLLVKPCHNLLLETTGAQHLYCATPQHLSCTRRQEQHLSCATPQEHTRCLFLEQRTSVLVDERGGSKVSYTTPPARGLVDERRGRSEELATTLELAYHLSSSLTRVWQQARPRQKHVQQVCHARPRQKHVQQARPRQNA